MGVLQMTWQPSLHKSQKRKHGGPPLGLRNLGNSCYLNSVLQCLTYTPPLANFCLRFLHSSICDLGAAKDKKGDCPFCILEKRITRSLSSEAASDAPLKINSCLRIYAEHFRTGRQEDAHEFLRYVIDACHNTCLRLKKLQQQQRAKNGVANGGDISGGGETVVKEIFGGALQSQVKCLSCGAESNKVDEIMDLSLDIMHSGSLKDALHKFFQPEILDGNNKYKCENCKDLVAARKQMSILEAPNVFVIQLKRFESMFGGKVDKPIAFEEILVLSSYMCKESQDQHPEYNLFGTIVHSGCSSDSGHYYAYIKDAIGCWYCCNDSYVSVSTLQEVLSEKVYILFFSRTKQRPRVRVGLMANGSKSHESNGSKMSTIQKANCVQKAGFVKQVSNQPSVTNNPTNSFESFESNGSKSYSVQKSGFEKPVGTSHISTHNSESSNSTNSMGYSGIKTVTMQTSGSVETLVSKKVSDHHPETNVSTASLGFNCCNSSVIQKSGALVEQGSKKHFSNHFTHTSNSNKSKVENSSPQRKLSISESTNRLLAAGNIKITVSKKKTKEDTGYAAASVISMEKEKTKVSANESNGVRKEVVDDQVPMSGQSSLEICNEKSVPVIANSLEGGFLESNGITTTMASRPSLDCQDLQTVNIMGSSNNSNMKRKMENGHPCILLAKDDKSLAEVEAFKELLGKEASLMLRSCGWSDELYDFMHASKRLCQEDGNSASNDNESKSLLISHAKRNFISKVPESLKGRLIELLRLFSQEKLSSGI